MNNEVGYFSMAASQSEHFAKIYNDNLMAQMQSSSQALPSMDCNAYANVAGNASLQNWAGMANASVNRLDLFDMKKRESDRSNVPMIYEDLT